MYWLWLLALFALPMLALVPWERLRGWLLSRRWQHDPNMVSDGWQLEWGTWHVDMFGTETIHEADGTIVVTEPDGTSRITRRGS